MSHSLIIFLLEHVISGVRAQMEQELESARLRRSALQMQIEVSKAELDAVKSKLKQQEDAIIEEQHRYDAVLADKTKEIQLEFYQLEQEAARHPVSCSHLALVFEAIHFLFCPKKIVLLGNQSHLENVLTFPSFRQYSRYEGSQRIIGYPFS